MKSEDNQKTVLPLGQAMLSHMRALHWCEIKFREHVQLVNMPRLNCPGFTRLDHWIAQPTLRLQNLIMYI